ncbi:nucleotidyl transferase AbiEii/AbiGii toxin family protein [Aestuariirhabdus sp. Z084]|uniref:nucleotidyl transferase AbiEii/AbiGii toxin family protein n=1 Tax=Aestuariirhabdus haliotis TaxID=2918751 RepID=UPI00201B3DBB|nr:nucleotidyl transferase AbiEii/AbiGii toxin family protein [Aestuariirhabdus haliotis]MCL6415515.1 nucleotidyl transferase AbiEii/AbiGii toxin family protein [Aestuariirhabdus haliotis]MCL6419280.1 nucleotidyl transferase AbiEii/AbiGii toxin family protein [Aestuariirhabdus haliotis]
MKQVAKLSEQERSELFLETATAMGVTAAAAEKDFWICWVLLHIFEADDLNQCLRFKGGTSLSKCYNAIERFSEDIDLILDWTRVTQEDPTESRSKTKQNTLNQSINEHAQHYIADTLLPRLIELMGDFCELAIDEEDPHTVNITYPKAFDSEYLRPQVRLEIGPLAAMLPMEWCSVMPYAAEHFPGVFEQVSVSVPTIVVARTFWEKLTILHAEAHRPLDKTLPIRYARHYYDVYKLVETDLYSVAMEQPELLAEVVAFKQKFYPSGWANYDGATFEGLVLQPSEDHLDFLKADYQQMQEMLFGDKPSFEDILTALVDLESDVHALANNKD